MKSLTRYLTNAAMGLGLLVSTSSFAGDTGLAREPLRSETLPTMLEGTVKVDANNFDSEVLGYKGAVVVEYHSTCHDVRTETGRKELRLDRNNDSVRVVIHDEFDETKIRGLPLKFASYDRCNSRPRGKFDTEMYLSGKLVDTISGSPSTLDKVPNSTNARRWWIRSNLLGQSFKYDGRETRVLFNDGLYPSFPAFSTAPVQP
jgi:hypothetical protein